MILSLDKQIENIGELRNTHYLFFFFIIKSDFKSLSQQVSAYLQFL